MKRTLLIIAATAVMAFAMNTQAGVMTATYTDSFTSQQFDFSDTLSLTQFDSSLGTLQSVQLSWSFDVTSTAGVENFSPNAGSAELNQTFEIEMDNTLLGTLASEGSGFSETQAVSAYDGTPDFAGTSGFTASVAPTYTDSVTYTTAPTLAAFTGTGDISFDVNGEVTITSDFFGTGAGFLAQTWNTFGDGEISVLYTYEAEPIPSPAAVWAGLMLAGAAVMRRRRR